MNNSSNDLNKLQSTNSSKQDNLKTFEFKILKEFDRICKSNNLNYSLAFGTLLGAVRHKGFIPWDDDIDVMMPLEDYIKFAKIAPVKMNDEFYFQSREINPKNFVYWNRMGLINTTSIDREFKKIKADWGICIDIFPIIKVSDDLNERKKEEKLLKIYQLLSLKYYHKATFKKASFKEKIKKLIHILIPDFLNIFISKKILKYFCKYNDIETKNCLELLDYFSLHRIYNSKIFNDYTELEFENEKFKVVEKWDEFLSSCYGDYMTPCEDKTNHSDNPNVYINFEHSYKELFKNK